MHPPAPTQGDIWTLNGPKVAPKRAKNPPKWPKMAHFGPKGLSHFFLSPGGKNRKNFLFKITIYDPPQGLGCPKPQNWPPVAPQLLPSGPFCVHFGSFGGRKTRFSRKIFLLQITFKAFLNGLGPPTTQNWPSGAPQRPPLGPFCVHFGPFGGRKT